MKKKKGHKCNTYCECSLNKQAEKIHKSMTGKKAKMLAGTPSTVDELYSAKMNENQKKMKKLKKGGTGMGGGY